MELRIHYLFLQFILFALIFLEKEYYKRVPKGLIIVLLAAAIVPSVVGTLKAVTNTPCPNNINYFGGEYPDIKVFDSYPKDFVQKSKNQMLASWSCKWWICTA